MILPVVAYGDPVLRKVAKEIGPDYPNLKELIANMKQTMYNASGVGIAAPQIGKSVRIFIIDATPFADDKDISELERNQLKEFKEVFINPTIINQEGDEWAFAEGCLSIPDIREDVFRQETVSFEYVDENFEKHSKTLNGLAARVFQHEYDHLEGILFTDKIEKYIPPGKGKTNTLRIIRELINHEVESDGTDLNKALEYLNNVQKKRAIVFVLSDYMTDGYETALTVAARRHDIVGMQIYDERETELPNVGLMHVRDAETGKTRILDTSSKVVRERYANWFAEHTENFRQLFAKTGADSLRINTEEDYVKELLRFFKQRGR